MNEALNVDDSTKILHYKNVANIEETFLKIHTASDSHQMASRTATVNLTNKLKETSREKLVICSLQLDQLKMLPL